MKLKKLTLIALVLTLVLSFAACGGKKDEAVIKAYDGAFSEARLMIHMTKMLVEEHTDVKVEIMPQMTAVNCFAEITAKNPSHDFMNGYDGSLLTTFLHLDITDVPSDMSMYDYANSVAMEKYGVRLLGQTGTDNTYALAMKESLAEEYGIVTISDLIPHAGEFIFGAEPDFFAQEGSMKYDPFVAFYGLEFKDKVSIDMALKYTGIEKDNFQVTEVFATDGLNKKAQLRVLEDDLEYFPEYNGGIIVRDEIFDTFKDVAPNLEEVMNMLEGKLSNEIMVDLTYRIDVEGEDLDAVAKEFLETQGLI